MANFGWAYVNCSGSGGGGGGEGSEGPIYSVQFMTASGTGVSSGSLDFTYNYTTNTAVLSGNLIVTGTVSASVFEYRDITVIDATGSTFFGDTIDDVHSRTGSLEIWSGTTAILTASSYSQQTFVKGFGANYTNVNAVVTPPANVFVTIPSPADFSAGAILVIKDEVTSARGLSNITLTRSVDDTYTFDGDPTYILTGTMPAISLYSNGSNWFVF
jgi:hypothetical protein